MVDSAVLKPYLRLLCCVGVVCFVSACGGGSSSEPNQTPAVVTPAAPDPQLNTFLFLPDINAELDVAIQSQITENRVFLRTPRPIDVTSLAPTFSFTGEQVLVNNVAQVSGETTHNFSDPVTYTVVNAEGDSKTYTVEVMQFTGLPIINMTTDNGLPITNREDYTTGTVGVFGNGIVSDLPVVPMEIRGRGNSTWAMPKKPYQMKLADKAAFLDMENDKKWLFLAEYADKTMLRNRMAFELGYISQLDWTPDSEFAELFLNDEYVGTYHITQKVEEGSDRVNIGDDGFLLEIDQLERLDPDDVYFYSGQFLVNIKAPDVVEGDAQYQYISRLVNEFENTLFSSNFTDPQSGYARHIDVDSFIDWYLISEITKNVDSRFFSSIYFHVVPGQKIKMGPLWDFDLSFGNVDYADPEFPEGWWIKFNPWFERLFQDPAFVEKVKTRFAFYRSQQAYIVSKMDEFAGKLQYAQAENDAVWQTIGIYVWPNPVVLDTYDAEVGRLQAWFETRMNWLNTQINAL